MALRTRTARHDPLCLRLPAVRLARAAPNGGGRRCGRPARRAYRRAMRFWDGSALVPLVVAHATSSVTDTRLAAAPLPAVWTLTPVEISSAIQSLFRDGVAREADGRAHELDERFMLSPACSASFLARGSRD